MRLYVVRRSMRRELRGIAASVWVNFGSDRGSSEVSQLGLASASDIGQSAFVIKALAGCYRSTAAMTAITECLQDALASMGRCVASSAVHRYGDGQKRVWRKT